MLLTRKEVAEYLRVSVQAVETLTQQGLLKSIPHEKNNPWFYFKSEVNRFLDERSDTMVQ